MENKHESKMEPISVSVSEAAQLLGVSRPKLYQIIQQEGLPYFKIGTRTLIPVAGLKEWVALKAENNGGAIPGATAFNPMCRM